MLGMGKEICEDIVLVDCQEEVCEVGNMEESGEPLHI